MRRSGAASLILSSFRCHMRAEERAVGIPEVEHTSQGRRAQEGVGEAFLGSKGESSLKPPRSTQST